MRIFKTNHKRILGLLLKIYYYIWIKKEFSKSWKLITIIPKPGKDKLLYSRIQLYYGNILKHNLRTSMNERTHFFIKIYLSRFILEKVAKGLMLIMCERWVGDGDRLLHIDPKVSLTIAALLSHLGWAAQPWVTEGPSPLSAAGSQFDTLSPTDSNCDWNSNWLELTNPSSLWHLVI